MIHIHHTDSGTSLVVSGGVRQLVVGAESLTIVSGTNATCYIHFFGNDIIPNSINGMDIALVASECCHISHTCIHIGSTDSMSYRLFLLQHRQMRLVIRITMLCLASIVEEELSLIQVFLISCSQVEFSQPHFCNLMSWYPNYLPWIGTYLTNYTVGIADGNIKKVALPCGLIVCHCCLQHVT